MPLAPIGARKACIVGSSGGLGGDLANRTPLLVEQPRQPLPNILGSNSEPSPLCPAKGTADCDRAKHKATEHDCHATEDCRKEDVLLIETPEHDETTCHRGDVSAEGLPPLSRATND